MTPTPESRPRLRRFAAVLGVTVGLLSVEGVARIVVAIWWPAEQVAGMTEMHSVVGRFASHPNLPYVLAPNLVGADRTHNALGFRGPEIAVPKPAGTLRVAGIGGSTTYGVPGRAEDAWPEALAARLRKDGRTCDAINAGVPGWVSTESLINLQFRVLPLEPDVVVVYEGRNEVFPESYNRFEPDYSHYRRGDYSLETANYGLKRLFRWSHAAMLLCTWRGDRFGWSSRDQNPAYGCTRSDNKPTVEEFAANVADPRCRATFRRNLSTMAAVCRSNGIECVLCTVADRPEKLTTGNLEYDPRYQEPFGRAIAANNDVVRETARREGAILVEGATLSEEPGLFTDDCHLTAEGYSRLAALMGDAIAASPAHRR